MHWVIFPTSAQLFLGCLLAAAAGLPMFDVILLGIGPDGHVASLFPNWPQTAAREGAWVLPIEESPKPPPERITFSMPVINRCVHASMVCAPLCQLKVAAWLRVGRAWQMLTLPSPLPCSVRPSACVGRQFAAVTVSMGHSKQARVIYVFLQL